MTTLQSCIREGGKGTAARRRWMPRAPPAQPSRLACHATKRKLAEKKQKNRLEETTEF